MSDDVVLWPEVWRSLSTRYHRVDVTFDSGVLGVKYVTRSLVTQGAVSDEDYLAASEDGTFKTANAIRWSRIIDMVGDPAHRKGRRPAWLAKRIARARWGVVEVHE